MDDEECLPKMKSQDIRVVDKSKGYLVVDYGDKIKTEFKVSQCQLKQQIEILQREITLIWEIMKDLMMLMGPMVLGWFCYFFTRMFLCRMCEGFLLTFNCFLMSACMMLFITPLTESAIRLIEAFEEFAELNQKLNKDKSEDSLVEETGYGDAGHLEVPDNQTDVENIGTNHEPEEEGSVDEDVKEDN